MGALPMGKTVSMDSFEGHQFSARKNGKVNWHIYIFSDSNIILIRRF